MKRLFIIPLLFITFSLFAAPIGEQKAREIALQFFASQGTRLYSSQLAIEWAGSDIESTSAHAATRTATGYNAELDESAIYIYNRLDKRGFVVVAGDDGVERAIIAFSHSNNFDVENMPDGAKEILHAWCKQIEATRNSKQSKMSSTRASIGVGNEVCKYETALWGQGAPFKDKSPNGRIGCVTTALAIVAHYHKWPSEGFGTTAEYSYRGSDGKTHVVPANKLGHKYNYDNMLYKYKGVKYTEKQAEAVATFFYDIGTAVGAMFDENNTTPIFDWALGMSTHFRYNKSAIKLVSASYTSQEWLDMLKQNLENCGPMIYRGTHEADNGGHAFVMDGYTDGNYFHFNFGWDGSSNGYYLLDNTNYPRFQAAIFYMTPDKDGTSTHQDLLSLVSFTGSSGIYKGLHTNAIDYKNEEQFATYIGLINAGNVNFSGEIGIAHCDKDNNIKKVVSSKTIDLNAEKKDGYIFTIQISTNEIEVGDKLLVVYQGKYSHNWQIARRYSDLHNPKIAYDEVLLSATPAEVAKSLELSYNKEDKLFTFTSEQAIQYSVTNSSGSKLASGKVASFTPTEIDATNFEQGEYTFSFASGGEPYTLTVVL